MVYAKHYIKPVGEYLLIFCETESQTWPKKTNPGKIESNFNPDKPRNVEPKFK